MNIYGISLGQALSDYSPPFYLAGVAKPSAGIPRASRWTTHLGMILTGVIPTARFIPGLGWVGRMGLLFDAIIKLDSKQPKSNFAFVVLESLLLSRAPEPLVPEPWQTPTLPAAWQLISTVWG